jgi:hypothetical protein
MHFQLLVLLVRPVSDFSLTKALNLKAAMRLENIIQTLAEGVVQVGYTPQRPRITVQKCVSPIF